MVWACNENWVKKCMNFIVDGRRSVGRPRRIWLENVEADMREKMSMIERNGDIML